MPTYYASKIGNDGTPVCGCDTCEFGPMIQITISGVLTCAGCYSDGTNDFDWSITGVNDSFPVTWSVNKWSGTNGQITINKYSSNTLTCVGLIASSTQVITWPISCTGINNFRITSPGNVFVTAFGYDWSIFSNSLAFPIGTPIPNANTALTCGVGLSAGYDGTLSVDLP